MIRHAFCPSATVGTLAVAMIEPAFRRLLVSAVGCAALNATSLSTAGRRAIDLPTLTRGTDIEDSPTTGSQAELLPESRPTFITHAEPRSGWTAGTEGGKISLLVTCASATEHPRYDPGCSSSRGYMFSGMLTNGLL